MEKNKLVLPITVLLSCVILGGFFYASQVNKQKSIERQQAVKIEEERRVERANEIQEMIEKEAEEKKLREKEVFNLQLQCNKLFDDLDKQFNNIAGVYYSELFNTCMVRYFEKGETKESAVEDFQRIR